MIERRRRKLLRCSIKMGNLRSMIINPLTTMLRKCPKGWTWNRYFMSSHIGSTLTFPTYYIPWIYLKMFHVICGVTYHPKKVTSWKWGEILFLQILKRIIGQDEKIEEIMTTHFHIKKAMSHGFWRKKILIWKRKLYWARRFPLVMCLLYDVVSLKTKIADLKSHDHLNLLRVCIMSKKWFYYYFISFTTQVKMKLFVCIYFVGSLSILCAWVCQPRLSRWPIVCHI